VATTTDSTQSSELDTFIPYLRQELVHMCLGDGGLSQAEQQQFCDFCDIFAAYTHFRSHIENEKLKLDYAPFDPDSEMKLRTKHTSDELDEAEARVANAFRELASNANFRQMTREEIEDSFHKKSLLLVNTDVDLDVFDQVECHVRGQDMREGQRATWYMVPKTVTVEVWRRVLILIKFKEDKDLTKVQKERLKKDQLPFEPGKFYSYLYKDVPKDDLEILFPNVRVSMNMADKIKLAIPALAGMIVFIAKKGLSLLILVALILLAFGIKLDRPEVEDVDPNNLKTVIAALAGLAALLTLAFKQWTKFKAKRIAFLKEVSDHLFFRSIANNRAVFNRMTESGEEEDCKEALLLYYHLLVQSKQGQQLNREQLDGIVEGWMGKNFDTIIDFDIDDPVEKLKKVVGKTNAGEEKPLLVEDAQGKLHVPSLQEAKEIIDNIWDDAYQFSDTCPEV
tara:strand:+ start:2666 stop:4021 length:1356 start_codon:yes stop_codon:yes gene_type:complete